MARNQRSVKPRKSKVRKTVKEAMKKIRRRIDREKPTSDPKVQFPDTNPRTR